MPARRLRIDAHWFPELRSGGTSIDNCCKTGQACLADLVQPGITEAHIGQLCFQDC